MTSSSRLSSGILFSVILLSSSGGAFADEFNRNNNPGGWYFYKDPIVLPEPPIPEPVITVTKEPNEEQEDDKDDNQNEEVKITSYWLRENLPKLLDEAQDNMTYENVRRYIYAQRIALDRATIFANIYRQVSQRETALNENLRRPSSSLELTSLTREINKDRRALFENHYDDFGVFFFISANCTYCESMVPVIDKLDKRFTLDILPVSIDGSTIESQNNWTDKTVFDDGTLVSAMPIDIAPTFYVLNKNTMSATKMATGFVSEDNFLQTLISAMRQLEVISEQEYQSTKQVKDIYLIPELANGEPELTVNEKELYENPDYLSDKLRKVFQEKYLSPNGNGFNAPGAVIKSQLGDGNNGKGSK